MKKVLFVNKFLYPNGGSETYIFKLGEELQRKGYHVQYFGMQDEKNVVGNSVNSYTGNMDFHTSKFAKFVYPFKIIYSVEARKAIRKVLDEFQPDVVHLNNINFQITPSIIYEIKKYERKNGKVVKIVFTAHDYQLVCPNHMLRCPNTEENCAKCIDGAFLNCVKGSCIHGSKSKSILGAIEGYFYRIFKAYKYIDVVICPSKFIQQKLEHHPQLKGKTVMMHNFATVETSENVFEKENYVVYFGRYSKEKGIETLIQVCKRLPNIRFVFAGKGPLEKQVNEINNIENKGFLVGEDLKTVIRNAKFSIYPSEWYENCPFSVTESIQYGTPVLGADIGGIPELIENGITGELFESGNQEQLEEKIVQLWNDKDKLEKYVKNCLGKQFVNLERYVCKLIEIYEIIR